MSPDKSMDLKRTHKKDMAFELYVDPNGEHRVRLRHKNGEILLAGESYKQKSDLKDTVYQIIQRIKDGNYEVKNLEQSAQADDQ